MNGIGVDWWRRIVYDEKLVFYCRRWCNDVIVMFFFLLIFSQFAVDLPVPNQSAEISAQFLLLFLSFLFALFCFVFSD